MNQKEKDCAYWVAVLLAGLVLGIVGGLAIAGTAYPIYQSEKWAAWVQAVGSIGAIVAAIFIMKEQAKEAEKRNQEYRNQVLAEKNEDFIKILDHLIETIQNLIARANIFEVFVLDKGADYRTDCAVAFQVLANSIEVIGLSGLPAAARLNSLILSIRQQAEELVSIVKKTEVDSISTLEAKQNLKLILMFLKQSKKTLQKEREHLIIKIGNL